MIAHARRHHATIRQNLEFVLGDMQAVPFRDGFDRVYSNAALHWARDLSAVAEGSPARSAPADGSCSSAAARETRQRWSQSSTT